MSRFTSRRTWVLGLLATPALLAAALLAPGISFAAKAPPARTVCGGLVPDHHYREDVLGLGREHACEHLQSRNATLPVTQYAATAQVVQSVAAVSSDPAVAGQWSKAVNPGTKTIGISAVLLHTGKVLLFGGKYQSTDKNTAAFLYDPVTGTGHEVPAPAAVFCGAITPLADGRVLSAGGASVIPKGIVDLWLFDPANEQWIKQPDSPLGRYYPTVTRLSDGRVVITAGTEVDGKTRNPTVELYTPPAPGQTQGTLRVISTNHPTGIYPRQWVMPDGNLLQVDGGRATFQLNTTSWAWNPLLSLPQQLGQGAAGLMLPGGPDGSTRVAMVGGLIKAVGQAHTMYYDYASPSAGWKLGKPLPEARAHMNLVQVPDGSAIGIGGNSSALYDVGQSQTLAYDPATGAWQPMAVQSVRRAYHSTAVLLPDGRIMSAGDTGPGGGRQLIDYYSPPYLFKGPRPVIDAAPAELSYGQSFGITTSGADAAAAVLMGTGATTHADEMNARHVALATTKTAGGLAATAPQASVAPPGYYMLFVLTADGVPSVAKWVHIT